MDSGSAAGVSIVDSSVEGVGSLTGGSSAGGTGSSVGGSGGDSSVEGVEIKLGCLSSRSSLVFYDIQTDYQHKKCLNSTRFHLSQYSASHAGKCQNFRRSTKMNKTSRKMSYTRANLQDYKTVVWVQLGKCTLYLKKAVDKKITIGLALSLEEVVRRDYGLENGNDIFHSEVV